MLFCNFVTWTAYISNSNRSDCSPVRLHAYVVPAANLPSSYIEEVAAVVADPATATATAPTPTLALALARIAIRLPETKQTFPIRMLLTNAKQHQNKNHKSNNVPKHVHVNTYRMYILFGSSSVRPSAVSVCMVGWCTCVDDNHWHNPLPESFCGR